MYVYEIDVKVVYMFVTHVCLTFHILLFTFHDRTQVHNRHAEQN